MNIYLDTMLWNDLCDQAVDPGRLLASLAAKNATVVLSHHTVFELAQTFINDPARGKALFSYIRDFVQANVPCTNEITGVLESEMLALNLPNQSIRPFLPPENYGKFRLDIEKLASGDFGDEAKAYVGARRDLGLKARSGVPVHLNGRIDIRNELLNVTESKLEEWIENELTTQRAVILLAEQITRQFPEAPLDEAMSWGVPLLASPHCRLASCLVRADLYYNWRCSHRGSVPRDLYHDIYHVWNAVYCDVYATKESGQKEYAAFLLTANTRVAIYDCSESLEVWLEALAGGRQDCFTPSNHADSGTGVAPAVEATPEISILSDEFAAAAAAAGLRARNKALAAGHAVIFIDDKGRYVEEFPDGRCFEIELESANTRETHVRILGELTPSPR